MHKTTPTSATTSTFPSLLSASVFSPSSSSSRPTTRDGSLAAVDHHHHPPHSPPPPVPFSGPGSLPFPPAHKEPRKLSFSRKAASLSGASTRRRGSSAASVASVASSAVITDAATPPALPDYALLAAAKIQSRDGRSPASPDAGAFVGAGGGGYFGSLSRTPTSLSTTTTMATGGGFMMPPPTPVTTGFGSSPPWQPSEASAIHQQITDVATKRISTLDYLRKACVSPFPLLLISCPLC